LSQEWDQSLSHILLPKGYNAGARPKGGMTNLRPHLVWPSGLRLRAAGAGLRLLLAFALAVPPAIATQAQTFRDLYSFTGSSDGAFPYGGVVQGKAGKLYGTASSGGSYYAGVVFEVSTSGQETVLYTFTASMDGAFPVAPLLRDKSGAFYGTASEGGSSYYGVVFKVDTTGKEIVLHDFGGGATDGCYPYGGLVRDKHGNLYGTTTKCGTAGLGTVFKLSRNGKETVLHSFAGGATDGASPYYTDLLIDDRGNLYGVTSEGGPADRGIVYKLSKNGTFTVLHSFAGGTTDGCVPYGKPAMNEAGNLYGTTEYCGTSSYGTVWKLTKKGVESILHNFGGGPTDGSIPAAGVVFDSSGNLYGDTTVGGAYGFGTMYKLSERGKMTLLHSFTGADGAFPFGGVLRDATGGLYGTTYGGGSGQHGTVWRLK